MAVVYLGSGMFIGLSGDTKPTTYASGVRFYETDTQVTKLWNGSAWVAGDDPGVFTMVNPYLDYTRVASQSNPSTDNARMYQKQVDTHNDALVAINKTGSAFTEVQLGGHPRANFRQYGYTSLTTLANGLGVFAGAVTTTLTGGGATTAINSVGGIMTRKLSTPAASPGVVNHRASAQITIRNTNPILLFSYTLNNTANVRWFCGFSGQTTAITASTPDPLASQNGLGLFYDSGANSGHVGILSNVAASGTSTFTEMSTAQTSHNASRHYVAIIADTTTPKYTLVFDGVSTNITNTAIFPTGTNAQGFQLILDNGADAAVKTLDLYSLEFFSN